jgi:hypothetical protein
MLAFLKDHPPVNPKSLYLIAVTAVAIVCLGVAVILSLFSDGEAVGKVLAIAATVIGSLVALGPTLTKVSGNGDDKKPNG